MFPRKRGIVQATMEDMLRRMASGEPTQWGYQHELDLGDGEGFRVMAEASDCPPIERVIKLKLFTNIE
jgi:hypothetical protein